MSETNDSAMVVVYTSPTPLESYAMQRALLSEGIRATVAACDEPHVGAAEVLVWREDEDRAREVVRSSEARHQQQVELEAEGLCDASREWLQV